MLRETEHICCRVPCPDQVSANTLSAPSVLMCQLTRSTPIGEAKRNALQLNLKIVERHLRWSCVKQWPKYSTLLPAGPDFYTFVQY